MSVKFIDQTIAFPPCPEPKRPGARRKASAGNNFLFVNSRQGQVPKQSRQPMRSHVMQRARSKRKWSTCKGIVNSTAESPRSSSEESGDEYSTNASTDAQARSPPPKIRAIERTISQITADSSNDESQRQAQGTNCPAESCAADCTTSAAPPIIKSDLALDPYCALPVRLDPASRWMLDQCKLLRTSLCSSSYHVTQRSFSFRLPSRHGRFN